MSKHKSVLLDECIENLNLKDNSIIVDCTLGYGGHSSEILKRISKGRLFAFDQDLEAISSSKQRLDEISYNYEIINSNFVNIKKELDKRNIKGVDGILYDLGVSSPQLDEDYRGFSFHQDARLDMRMDQNNSLDAYYVVNNYSYDKLVEIFYKYGEEKYATSIAKNIIKDRTIKNIETTFELVEIIKKSMPMKAKRDGHPARRSFQAIRIEVNRELEVLEQALEQALDLLNIGGRLCVISFQSLEDRIVKNKFRTLSEVPEHIKKLPYIPDEYQPKFKIISKGITAINEELENNSRSHSARLRVIEKCKE